MSRYVEVVAVLFSLWCMPGTAAAQPGPEPKVERAAPRPEGERRAAGRRPSARRPSARRYDVRWPDGSALLVPLLTPILFPFLVPHELVPRGSAGAAAPRAAGLAESGR